MSSPPSLEKLRESLYSAVVCDALDAMGYRNQSPRISLAPYTSERTLIGRCKTTLWHDMYHEVKNPYELELRAVDGCQADDVFIAATGGSQRSAVWGELLSTAASNRGCVGAIVDGSALGTSPYDSQNRQRVVDIDVPVEIAGVTFRPGDLVIADVDGVVLIPKEAEQEALRRAWEKVHSENEVREAIRQGMKASEAYDKFGVL